PHYMSPEQIANEDGITGKADQFSLGVIAYLMLTGRKPFDGKSLLAISQKIQSEDPPAASKVEKSLSPEVDNVLLKVLAKSPKDRYPTCSAFVEDLQRAIEGAPPRSVGSSRWFLVAAALVILFAAAGYAAWRYWPKPPVNFDMALSMRTVPINGRIEAPGSGDISSMVRASRALSPGTRVELTLVALSDGQVLDRADLSGDPAGMKHTFDVALSPGDYAARLSVDGVPRKEVRFGVDGVRA